MVAPTGAGKTVIAAEMIRRASEKGSTIYFLAHRTELIDQCSEKLSMSGVKHSTIVASGRGFDSRNPVQVASKDTLHSWFRRGRLPDESPSLVVVDECHRSVAKTYSDIMNAWSQSRIVGLTATPYRGDGKGLGREYDAIVVVAQIHELIRDGALVKPRIFVGDPPDLAGVRTRGGDYMEKDLGEALNTPTLVGNVVDSWLKHAADRPTIVFAATIAHSLALTERFQAIGIRAEHADGSFKPEERARIVADFRAGKIQVLSNCQLFTEGFDATACSAVVLARPTKSTGLYLQMAGRALRPHPGKSDCVVVDLAGAYHQHGHVAEPRSFSLEDDKAAIGAATAKQKEEFEQGEFEAISAESGIPIEIPAELREAVVTDDPQADFYRREMDAALRRGEADAMRVHVKFLKRFGEWPPPRIAKPYVSWEAVDVRGEAKKRPVWKSMREGVNA